MNTVVGGTQTGMMNEGKTKKKKKGKKANAKRSDQKHVARAE